MKSLLIVYCSMTTGTWQLAQAAASGAASEEGVAVHLHHARDIGAQAVLTADGYIFATPECLGSMAGLMKDFFDRTYYDVLEQVNGRPYLSLICAGSDGRGAAAQIAKIATGWRLKAVAEPFIVCTHAQTPEQILRSKVITPADVAHGADLGKTLAGGLVLGIF